MKTNRVKGKFKVRRDNCETKQGDETENVKAVKSKAFSVISQRFQISVKHIESSSDLIMKWKTNLNVHQMSKLKTLNQANNIMKLIANMEITIIGLLHICNLISRAGRSRCVNTFATMKPNKILPDTSDRSSLWYA